MIFPPLIRAWLFWMNGFAGVLWITRQEVLHEPMWHARIIL